MASEGEGSGIATIEGDTAIFKPKGSEEKCQITLRFTGSKLVVTQTGICGFGHNVSAEGIYKKFRLRSRSLDWISFCFVGCGHRPVVIPAW